MIELFTGSTALKLVNALNKPPLKLSLSYHGLSYIEWRKSVPPILAIASPMAPVRVPTLEIPSPWHLFTCLPS